MHSLENCFAPLFALLMRFMSMINDRSKNTETWLYQQTFTWDAASSLVLKGLRKVELRRLQSSICHVWAKMDLKTEMKFHWLLRRKIEKVVEEDLKRGWLISYPSFRHQNSIIDRRKLFSVVSNSKTHMFSKRLKVQFLTMNSQKYKISAELFFAHLQSSHQHPSPMLLLSC